MILTFVNECKSMRKKLSAIEDKENRINQIYAKIAARFIRGNIAMQTGKILTPDALNKERDALSRDIKAGKI